MRTLWEDPPSLDRGTPGVEVLSVLKKGLEGSGVGQVPEGPGRATGQELGRSVRARSNPDGLGPDGACGCHVLRRIPDHHEPALGERHIELPGAPLGTPADELHTILVVRAKAAEGEGLVEM